MPVNGVRRACAPYWMLWVECWRVPTYTVHGVVFDILILATPRSPRPHINKSIKCGINGMSAGGIG